MLFIGLSWVISSILYDELLSGSASTRFTKTYYSKSLHPFAYWSIVSFHALLLLLMLRTVAYNLKRAIDMLSRK